MPIVEIDSESHWHELRAGCIGASEIGALFDDGHPFTSRHALWSRLKGLLPGMEVNPLMERGKEMEPLITKNIERTFGVPMLKCNQHHTHPDYPWLACSLDYYALDHPDGEGPAGVQIKNVVHGQDKWSPTRAPDYVEFQVQQEMLVTNAARRALGLTPFKRWFIGFERFGNPEDVHLIERRPIPGVAQAIIERSSGFMEALRGGAEPEIDSPLDYAHIRLLFLAADIKEIEILDLRERSASVEGDIAAWEAAKIAAKKATDSLAIFKTRLLRHCLVIDAEDIDGYLRADTLNKRIHVRNANGLRIEVSEAGK